LAAACLLASPVARAGAATHEVLVQDLVSSPSVLAVAVGDSVRWLWQNGIHTVTSGTPCEGDGLFDEPLDAANPEFAFEFNDAGTVDYFCLPHCALGMTGQVIVGDAVDVGGAAWVRGGGLRLLGASPNPFRPRTSVRFELARDESVRFEIFDLAGATISWESPRPLPAGVHEFAWDGARKAGGPAPAGIYFARVATSRAGATLKIVMVQ
jgi:plastocyanin